MDPVVNKESAKSKKDTIEKPRVAQYKFYLLFIFISQTEELTKIDKLYTRMQDLEIVLDGIDRSAATLRHMIDSYSLSTTTSLLNSMMLTCYQTKQLIDQGKLFLLNRSESSLFTHT